MGNHELGIQATSVQIALDPGLEEPLFAKLKVQGQHRGLEVFGAKDIHGLRPVSPGFSQQTGLNSEIPRA